MRKRFLARAYQNYDLVNRKELEILIIWDKV